MRVLRNTAAGYSNGTAALVVSSSYAALVIGAFLFVVIYDFIKPGSLAALYLVMVTLPGSILVSFIPAEENLYVLQLTVVGLAQAWLLWVVLRGRRLS